MQNQLSEKTKNLIIKTAAAFMVVILLLVLTWLALGSAKKKSRDTQRLSDISGLRSDLGSYYYRYNKFPRAILDINAVEDVKKDCPENLCLKTLPIDPLFGLPYKYTPCQDSNLSECLPDISDPAGYIIEYRLESDIKPITSGRHFATPSRIY